MVGLDQTFKRAAGRARRKTLDSIFFVGCVRVRAKERPGGKGGRAGLYAA